MGSSTIYTDDSFIMPVTSLITLNHVASILSTGKSSDSSLLEPEWAGAASRRRATFNWRSRVYVSGMFQVRASRQATEIIKSD